MNTDPLFSLTNIYQGKQRWHPAHLPQADAFTRQGIT